MGASLIKEIEIRIKELEKDIDEFENVARRMFKLVKVAEEMTRCLKEKELEDALKLLEDYGYQGIPQFFEDYDSTKTIFGKYVKRLQNLYKDVNYGITCPNCGGSGIILKREIIRAEGVVQEYPKVERCSYCNGKGVFIVPEEIKKRFDAINAKYLKIIKELSEITRNRLISK